MRSIQIFLLLKVPFDPFDRVFPKDLPISDDMQVIISLNVDNSVDVKEEKKMKKPRKSNSDVNKPRKYALKHELETDIGDDDQSEDADGEVDDDSMGPPSSKGAKLSSLGRKIVAEKVAEAVRKSYESTTEFETTSAQMFKLAQTVVSKQVEQQPIVEKEEVPPKGPSLVLASSIEHSLIDDKNDEEFNNATNIQDDNTSSNGKPKGKEDVASPDSDIISTGGRKRRGRPPIKNDKNNGLSPNHIPPPTKEKLEEESVNETTSKTKSSDEEKNKSPLQGVPPLTRSKRDKVKK